LARQFAADPLSAVEPGRSKVSKVLFSRPSADFAALGRHPASSGRLPRAALPRSNGLRPALTKTNELNAGTSRRDGDSLTQLKVQSKIESFPSSLLTQRERQVLF